MKWRSRPQDDILWAHFDEDYIAFQRSSGNTHFLNAASYVLLCDVLSKPCDLDMVVCEFMMGEQDIDEAEYRDQMSTLLDHLETLGLVDRVR